MGWILGLLGGIAEFYLLKTAVVALANQQKGKATAMLFLNILCLFAVSALVVAFFRQQLLPCGLLMTGALVIPSILFYSVQKKKKDVD